MNAGIAINHLERRFHDFILGPIDAELPAGNITAIIGKNSSGKTALLSCISGSYAADSGDVRYSKPVIGGNMGIVLDRCPYPPDIDAYGLSKLMSIVIPGWDRRRFFHLCSFLDIDPELRIAEVSKGNQTKLQVAVSLSHETDYLLMDEPTSGLDPGSKDKVLGLVREYVSDERHTVVIASHDAPMLEVNADYVLLLDGGKQVLFDDMNAVMSEYGRVNAPAKPIQREYVIGEESGRYGSAIFIKGRPELSESFPELGIEDVTLEDLVMHCGGLVN
ncbi:MAG: ABC transporter ATP-binding protein [Candidatus Methanomethylophilaceae archaeon]|nr:ABC transporter ATP-binding protein [Candidatus Methanomethylophilaceae archaeon]